MKHIIKTSLVLIFFSLSIIIFNLSCEKESTAQANTSYTLPKATTSSLGGVIVGSGLSVTDNGTISTQNFDIIIFSRNGDKENEFWTAKHDGTNQKKITIPSLPTTEAISKDQLRLSPDGKKFFFKIYYYPNNTGINEKLYSCNIDGSGLTKLIDDVAGFSDLK
jgi:hypothetical protein